jgi:hypothetical protein
VAFQDAALERVALSDREAIAAGNVGGEVVAGLPASLVAKLGGCVLKGGLFHLIHQKAPSTMAAMKASAA